jgi:hypothetical protein
LISLRDPVTLQLHAFITPSGERERKIEELRKGKKETRRGKEYVSGSINRKRRPKNKGIKREIFGRIRRNNVLTNMRNITFYYA